MRVFVKTNRAVVIALNDPLRWQHLLCPSDALGGLRAVIDEVAKAKNLPGVGFSFKDGAKGGPVSVYIGYDEQFHNSLP